MLTENEENGRFSQAQVAKFCGVTQRSVREWSVQPDDGGADGRTTYYRGTDIIEFLIGREAEKRARTIAPDEVVVLDDDGVPIDKNAEQLRKLKAERIGQEIRNAQALAELAPRDLMDSVLVDVVKQFVQLVETIPSTIKKNIPDIDPSTLDALERDLAKLRNGIAEAEIDYSDERMAKHRPDSS